jgi:hypothetical protein
MGNEQHLASSQLKEDSKVTVDDDGFNAQVQLRMLASAHGLKACTEESGRKSATDSADYGGGTSGKDLETSSFDKGISGAGGGVVKQAAQVLVASQAGESLAPMGTCMRKLLGLYGAVWRHPLAQQLDERDCAARCRLDAQGVANPGDVCRPIKGRVVRSAKDLSALNPELDQCQAPSFWEGHVASHRWQPITPSPHELCEATAHSCEQTSNEDDRILPKIESCNILQQVNKELGVQRQDENSCSEPGLGRKRSHTCRISGDTAAGSMHRLLGSDRVIVKDVVSDCSSKVQIIDKLGHEPNRPSALATDRRFSPTSRRSKDARVGSRARSTDSILRSIDNQAASPGALSYGWTSGQGPPVCSHSHFASFLLQRTSSALDKLRDVEAAVHLVAHDFAPWPAYTDFLVARDFAPWPAHTDFSSIFT